MARMTVAATFAALCVPQFGWAEADVDKVDALFQALRLNEMIAVMQEEGLDYGADLAVDLFPSGVSGEWTAAVAQIYDAAKMQETVAAGLTAALSNDEITGITAFFSSELGAEIIGLELSARIALQDEALEEAAQDAAALALIDETPRAKQLEAFVAANDLVETNVVGALNASFAFYQGLSTSGGLPGEISEEQMLDDVWAQEPEIRTNTTEWVYGYAMLAYDPLSDADLDAYIAFSETDTGRAFNAAMFAAFDDMYVGISGSLLRSAAAQIFRQ